MGEHSAPEPPIEPDAVPADAPPPTQSQHPWRATARTAFAFMVGFAPLAPVIVDASGVPAATPGVAAALAISAGVTRVLAAPQVNDFLQRWVPWLAAEPRG